MNNNQTPAGAGEAAALFFVVLLFTGGLVSVAILIWAFALYGDMKSWLTVAGILGIVIGAYDGVGRAFWVRPDVFGMLVRGVALVAGFIGGVVWLLRSLF